MPDIRALLMHLLGQGQSQQAPMPMPQGGEMRAADPRQRFLMSLPQPVMDGLDGMGRMAAGAQQAGGNAQSVAMAPLGTPGGEIPGGGANYRKFIVRPTELTSDWDSEIESIERIVKGLNPESHVKDVMRGPRRWLEVYAHEDSADLIKKTLEHPSLGWKLEGSLKGLTKQAGNLAPKQASEYESMSLGKLNIRKKDLQWSINDAKRTGDTAAAQEIGDELAQVNAQIAKRQKK